MTTRRTDLRLRIATLMGVAFSWIVFSHLQPVLALPNPDRDPAANPKCDLSKTRPTVCYRKHADNVYRALFFHYGNNVDIDTVTRIANKFRDRVNEIQDVIQLEFTGIVIVPLKKREWDLEAVRSRLTYPDHPSHTPERLTRLWYMDQLGKVDVLEETYEQIKVAGYSNELSAADGYIGTTEPQVPGLALAMYAGAVVEYPREVAWDLPDGGRTEWTSDELMLEQLVHEFGHVLGLTHVATHCFGKESSTQEDLEKVRACCAASPNAHDVMSYCRDRRAAEAGKIQQFSDCSLNWLRKKFINQFKNGKTRIAQSIREMCR